VDADELTKRTAESLQLVGSSFYFDPGTVARGEALGLNAYEFYGLGRAGVMGDVEPDEVVGAFHFFHPKAIHFIYQKARAKAAAVSTARHYVEAAYDFAGRAFAGVPVSTLADFATASRAVVDGVAPGRYALFDGYRGVASSPDPVSAAYLGAIQLRELRGGVHIAAVRAVDLGPAEACLLQDVSVFALHGYADGDAAAPTAALAAKKREAERLTDHEMAACYSVIGGVQRQHVADGAAAMLDALQSPVPAVR
jgi:Helix-turn-helix family